MPCSTTCIECNDKFDRFSGKLINLSDSCLKEFYALPRVKEFLSNPNHKHVTLCASCLIKLLGRDLTLRDFKFKNGWWMTSNVAYLIRRKFGQDSPKLEELKSLDKGGLLPFKHTYDGDFELKLKFFK